MELKPVGWDWRVPFLNSCHSCLLPWMSSGVIREHSSGVRELSAGALLKWSCSGKVPTKLPQSFTHCLCGSQRSQGLKAWVPGLESQLHLKRL